MANLSDLSRKEQVLEYLKIHLGEWIDGVDLANEEVGGSEGLKRLRELRDEGYLIQKRQKPGADQWQYRLVEQEGIIQPSYRMESIPNGGAFRDPDPVVRPAARPVEGIKPSNIMGWQLVDRVYGRYLATFKIRGEEIPGEISRGFDGVGWHWGLRIPARGPTRSEPMRRRGERRYGRKVETREIAELEVQDKLRELTDLGFG